MAVPLARKVCRFFKKVGLVGYSKKRNIFGIHPLFISTLYIILILFLADLLRKLINTFFGSDGIVKQLLLEFVATLELCGTCFELIIVADNWGVSAYAIYLFLLTIWWSTRWNGISACPYSPLEELVEGTRDLSTTALVIFSQILAALITFRYVQLLWAMELVETHKGKAFEHCTADLQVHYILGAIVEAGATCLCRIASKILSGIDTKYGYILDAFFGTIMVVAAFNYSGGYFNPALATSLKLGCKGNTFVEHMIVYWIGSSFGSVLSVFIYKSKPLQNYINNLKEKTD